MAIVITNRNEWVKLASLDTVVDPMIIRAGELFLQGAGDEETWAFLSSNLHGVGMFFDTLVVRERIPVFDYGDTYDMSLSPLHVFDLVNINDEILVPVSVGYEAYGEVKRAALGEVAALYEGPRAIERGLADSIGRELSAADYRWNPSLGELESRLASDEERRIAKFMLGGLIFGGYAQILGGEHLLQPKRSRLFLAAALRAPSADHELEQALFASSTFSARSPRTRCR